MDKIFKLNLKNKNNFFFLILILLIFSSTTKVFAQTAGFEISTLEVLIKNDLVIENPVNVSNSENSNVNFILWFMGTKEDVGNSYSDTGVYSKKNFMISGREPNRLLVKTLLKKTLNIKSC